MATHPYRYVWSFQSFRLTQYFFAEITKRGHQPYECSLFLRNHSFYPHDLYGERQVYTEQRHPTKKWRYTLCFHLCSILYFKKSLNLDFNFHLIGDLNRGWHQVSLFDRYYRKVGPSATSFPGLLHLALDPYLIMLSVKQRGIKHHFLSLWYDSTWDWTLVSPGLLANTLTILPISKTIYAKPTGYLTIQAIKWEMFHLNLEVHISKSGIRQKHIKFSEFIPLML